MIIILFYIFYGTDFNFLENLKVLNAGMCNFDECYYIDPDKYHTLVTFYGNGSREFMNTTNESIKNLTNIEELYLSGNFNIYNINHLKKLKILDASITINDNGIYSCGIDDESIQNLINIEVLNANGNGKITDVNHLTNLRILSAKWCENTYDGRTAYHYNGDYHQCGIDDDGIKNLKILKY